MVSSTSGRRRRGARGDAEGGGNPRRGGRGRGPDRRTGARTGRRRGPTRAPTLARIKMAAPGAMRSSWRARPAPSSVAARPRSPASACATKPARGARTTRLCRAPRQPVGVVDDARVAALQANAQREALEPVAAVAGAGHPGRAVAQVAGHAPQHQHLGAQAQRQVDQIGRTAAPQDVDGLAHLDGVADGVAQRLVHVRQHGAHRQPQRPARARSTSAPARASGSSDGKNAPLPALTSITSAAVPSATFLDRIDDAMSGIDSTVAVASRSA